MRRLSRTLSVWLVVLSLSVLPVPPVLANDMGRKTASAMDGVGELEVVLWGKTRQGPALERTGALEEALFGKAEQGPVLTRLDLLREYLLPGSPRSVAVRLSSLELTLFERVNSLPLAVRLDEVERSLSGGSGQGSILERIEAALKAVGLNDRKALRETIPAGLPVRVRLLDAVGTDQAVKDQTLAYQVVESVTVDGTILVGAGARGTAHVVSVTTGGMLGQDGRLELNFCAATAVDGSLAPLTSPQTAFAPPRGNRSRALAAGAGMAGIILVGPAGAAAAVLVKGREVEFPAGTEFELVTGGGPAIAALGK